MPNEGKLAYDTETDRQWSGWMAAAQTGDSQAYDSLLRGCLPFIAQVARGQRVPADRVDDVVQDVLMTVHRARHTYDPSRSFTAWLRVIAQRRAIDVLRRSGRQNSREVHAPLAFEIYADPGAQTSDAWEKTGLSAHIGKAIASLSPGQKEAVERLVLREQSLQEAATATGRSKGALKVNLHRALIALRRQLDSKE
ncbi:MAG: sigma-70 family RNA polymerase sigma factor [Pseudomonadota bacterium]